MSETPSIPGDVETPRPRFIKNIAGAAAVIPIHTLATAQFAEAAGSALAASPPPTPAPVAASPLPDGYQFFSAGEAAFVEALVTTLCPADELTPDGMACGLATSWTVSWRAVQRTCLSALRAGVFRRSALWGQSRQGFLAHGRLYPASTTAAR